MKVIVTKLYGPHRIKATDNDGNTAIIDRASALSLEDQHDHAARALCDRMQWHGTLVKGYMLHAGVTAARVYVWTGEHATTLTV